MENDKPVCKPCYMRSYAVVSVMLRSRGELVTEETGGPDGARHHTFFYTFKHVGLNSLVKFHLQWFAKEFTDKKETVTLSLCKNPKKKKYI